MYVRSSLYKTPFSHKLILGPWFRVITVNNQRSSNSESNIGLNLTSKTKSQLSKEISLCKKKDTQFFLLFKHPCLRNNNMTALMLSGSWAPSRMASNPGTRRWIRPSMDSARPGNDYAIRLTVVLSVAKFYCI